MRAAAAALPGLGLCPLLSEAVARFEDPSVTMPGTQTIPAPKIKPAAPEVTPDSGWKVLLFNDEVHDFDLVIFALQRAAGLSLEVAEMVAVECDQEGEAVVKRGLEHDEALIICGGLRKWTRIEGVTPGVACEAVRDDA